MGEDLFCLLNYRIQHQRANPHFSVLVRALTNTWMDDLAELPKDIANNNQLYIALRNFLDEGTGGGGGPAYCQFSPDYNCYRCVPAVSGIVYEGSCFVSILMLMPFLYSLDQGGVASLLRQW